MVEAPIIYYWSHPSTRNTEEVAQRIERELGIEVRHILNSKKEADSPYVLMTPTYEGKVDARDPYIPNAVKRWLKASRARRQLIVGVIGTGNLNFGAEYCMAAKMLCERLRVPLLHRIDVRGDDDDYEILREGFDNGWDSLVAMRREVVDSRKVEHTAA